MNTLIRLQNWYKSNCNGDWEHSFGLSINTLDNPGWLIEIDLEETKLAGKQFANVDIEMDSKNKWISCKIENNVFIGACASDYLEQVLLLFLDWADGT